MKHTPRLRYMLVIACVLLQAKSYSQVGLIFDGTDDKVDCGNNTSVQITGTSITLEAWIYPTAWKTNVYEGNVICKEDNTGNNGYMLRVGAGGKLNFALGDGTKNWSELTSSALLSLNTWQHIAGTYDGSKMRLYINGAAVDSAAYSINIGNASSINLLLGAHSTYTRFFQGIIDEVRIWSVTRSEAEINSNQGNEFCSPIAGLKAYYKFNQGKPGGNNGANKSTKDLSGYSNTGTLSQFSLTGSVSNWVKGKALTKGISYGSETTTRCDFLFSPTGRFKWTKSGTYRDTILTVMECDSVVVFNLTIKYSSSSNIKVTSCGKYTSPSGLYTWTKSGVYKDFLRNYLNCDSIVNITLTVGGSRDTIYPKQCYSYTSPSKKYTWNNSGIYFDTLKEVVTGCDSILQINLTINKASFKTNVVKACNFYVGPGAKKVYSKTGIYKDTMLNKQGCDSIVTTDLTILNTSSTIYPTACNSYTSPGGKMVLNSSGTYFDTITNKAGCDSAITIHLTILKSSSKTIFANTCNTYLSPSKRKVYSTTGIYKDTIPNFSGCDSIITIDLTVTTINTNVTLSGNTLTALHPTGGCRWLDCSNMAPISGATLKSFTPTKNGDYAAELSDNGCKDTSICIAVSGLGTAHFSANSDLGLYPNPAKNEVHILLPIGKENGSVQIFDQAGRLAKSIPTGIANDLVVKLDFLPGLYTVMYQNGNQKETRYLVVE